MYCQSCANCLDLLADCRKTADWNVSQIPPTASLSLLEPHLPSPGQGRSSRLLVQPNRGGGFGESLVLHNITARGLIGLLLEALCALCKLCVLKNAVLLALKCSSPFEITHRGSTPGGSSLPSPSSSQLFSSAIRRCFAPHVCRVASNASDHSEISISTRRTYAKM